MENTTPAVEELLDAIETTQKYVNLPCKPGWAWWDAYIKHRPNQAAELYYQWRQGEAHKDAPVEPKEETRKGMTLAIRAHPGEHVSDTAMRAVKENARYYVHNDRVYPAGLWGANELNNRQICKVLVDGR